jgi:hypothetical protein
MELHTAGDISRAATCSEGCNKVLFEDIVDSSNGVFQYFF